MVSGFNVIWDNSKLHFQIFQVEAKSFWVFEQLVRLCLAPISVIVWEERLNIQLIIQVKIMGLKRQRTKIGKKYFLARIQNPEDKRGITLVRSLLDFSPKLGKKAGISLWSPDSLFTSERFSSLHHHQVTPSSDVNWCQRISQDTSPKTCLTLTEMFRIKF